MHSHTFVEGGTHGVAAADIPTALETIVVTAQRRVEDQQHVPIAISTIDGDETVQSPDPYTGRPERSFAPGLLATYTRSPTAPRR